MRFLVGMFVVVALIMIGVDPAFAQDAHVAPAEWGKFAAGIAIGVAALGGALGQGRAVAAALESIGRNPGASGQMFTPMIVGLVLIESLVIYALVIALKLAGFF